MSTILLESQAISGLAEALYDFLPGKPYPYANQQISFPGAADAVGLGQYWTAGSKLPAITLLLQQTLDKQRGRFCDLILEIIKRGTTYRSTKQPITREEVEALNQLILNVGFKIPEMWDAKYLNSLSSSVKPKGAETNTVSKEQLNFLKDELLGLQSIEPTKRGFAFEKFLKGLFAAFGLEPRNSFRMVGEQIDGSLQHEGHTYLIEAKWQNEMIGNKELLIFHGKVEGKSTWSRGLLISYSGFTPDGLEAFSRGRSTSIVGMDGFDLCSILDGNISLTDAISLKARQAAETGRIMVTVYELTNLKSSIS